MKKRILFLIIVSTFVCFKNSYSQTLTTPVGPPLEEEINFERLLAMTGVTDYTTATGQIAAFEDIFQPALYVIRSVPVGGLSYQTSLNKYYNFIHANNLYHTIQNSIIPSHGVPYLSIFLRLHLKGYTTIPLEWAMTGYLPWL